MRTVLSFSMQTMSKVVCLLIIFLRGSEQFMNCNSWDCHLPYHSHRHYHPIPPSNPDRVHEYPPIVCDFNTSEACSFVSDQQLIPFQWNQSLKNTSGDGFMVWQWTEINNTCVFGGRFHTTPFPTNGLAQGCLNLRFLTWGPGISDLRVYQHDDHYRCLYFHPNVNFEPVDRMDRLWQDIYLLVDSIHGEPVFTIEVMSNRASKMGFVAIDRIEYNYHWC